MHLIIEMVFIDIECCEIQVLQSSTMVPFISKCLN